MRPRLTGQFERKTGLPEVLHTPVNCAVVGEGSTGADAVAAGDAVAAATAAAGDALVGGGEVAGSGGVVRRQVVPLELTLPKKAQFPSDSDSEAELQRVMPPAAEAAELRAASSEASPADSPEAPASRRP